MRLSRLKETLRPCSNFSSSTATASSSSNPELSSQIPLPLRKPPKSSLSQQLQRLEFPSAERPLLRDVGKEKEPRRGGGGGEKEDGGDGERSPPPARFNRETLLPQPFTSGVRGPYEPLVLSSPGETPVIKVILAPPTPPFSPFKILEYIYPITACDTETQTILSVSETKMQFHKSNLAIFPLRPV